MENTVAELQGDDMGQLESNQQEKHDPVVAVVAQPAQDESCNDTDMKSKLELGPALEINMEVDTDVGTIRARPREKSEDNYKKETSSGSSRPTDDATDDEILWEVIGERERNKHDAYKRLGDETCGTTCLKKSTLDPHMHPASDMEDDDSKNLESSPALKPPSEFNVIRTAGL